MKNITNLESGWPFIIVACLFLLLSAMFGGCNNGVPKGKYIINQIVESRNPHICEYRVKESFWVFEDSCGKMNIGDTIIIKW